MTLNPTRTQVSQAVENIGWRYLLGCLVTTVPVDSLRNAHRIAAVAVNACDADADSHLRVLLRRDHVELTVQEPSTRQVTAGDIALAQAITRAVRDAGLETTPRGPGHSVQSLEIAIDAMDIAVVRPFWKAVLGYDRDPGGELDLVDGTGSGPALWFQQMEEPRPQRNRIHFDLTVPHDEAPARIASALAAGGRMLDQGRAPAFWVLADPEGNEVCVCTWQNRD